MCKSGSFSYSLFYTNIQKTATCDESFGATSSLNIAVRKMTSSLNITDDVSDTNGCVMRGLHLFSKGCGATFSATVKFPGGTDCSTSSFGGGSW